MGEINVNAVIVAVAVMLFLSLARANVVISLIIGAIAGGLAGDLSLGVTIKAFNAGITNGAEVALNYALLGAFAVAISKSGLPDYLAAKILHILKIQGEKAVRSLKWGIVLGLLAVSISSQNLIPIHIAFIPLLIPPLLPVIDRLGLDRRLIACILTFGLITPYMFLPVGFGQIFLSKILLGNIEKNGLSVENISVMTAMALPALGMVIGLVTAFFSYHFFRNSPVDDRAADSAASAESSTPSSTVHISPWTVAVAIIAITAAFILQLYTESMIMGALIGFLLFSTTGVVRWKESDGVFIDGMKMMAMVGFIMITAAGFAEVLRETGQIDSLVARSVEIIGGSKALGSFVMLFIGLVITLGIGSSFSTIPIIAAIYVPLAVSLGFSPLATVALIGAAGALGDAGSPASDSTLGPTAGLNADGRHDHIWHTVVPTFLHYNLPLLAFGWLATMVLP